MSDNLKTPNYSVNSLKNAEKTAENKAKKYAKKKLKKYAESHDEEHKELLAGLDERDRRIMETVKTLIRQSQADNQTLVRWLSALEPRRKPLPIDPRTGCVIIAPQFAYISKLKNRGDCQ